MSLYKEAYAIAEEVHKNQFRIDEKTPYIKYPEAVVEILKEMGVDNESVLSIAILHDVIEDTDEKDKFKKKILNLKYGWYINNGINTLTHKPGRSYEDYIMKIRKSQSSVLIRIKQADIIHNLTDSPTRKQMEKYKKALIILLSFKFDRRIL